MKVLFTTLAFVFCVTILTASIDPYDMVILADPTSGSVVVRSTVPLSHAGTLVLEDARGRQLFNGEIAEGGYISKRFPIKYLPTGKYLLTLTDATGRTSLPFNCQHGVANYSPRDGHRTIFPSVNLGRDKKLTISYPASGGRPIEIALRQDDGAAVFTDQVQADVAIRKAYRLNALAAGSYVLTVEQEADIIHRTSITLR